MQHLTADKQPYMQHKTTQYNSNKSHKTHILTNKPCFRDALHKTTNEEHHWYCQFLVLSTASTTYQAANIYRESNKSSHSQYTNIKSCHFRTFGPVSQIKSYHKDGHVHALRHEICDVKMLRYNVSSAMLHNALVQKNRKKSFFSTSFANVFMFWDFCGLLYNKRIHN